MIEYVSGDLLAAPQEIIAHGCNTLGRCGAGVARRWPQARAAYLQRHAAGGWQLGDVQLVPCGDKLIANLAIRADRLDYEAVRLAFHRLVREAELLQSAVAMPRLGTGGQWPRIEPLLQQAVRGRQVRVVVYARGKL